MTAIRIDTVLWKPPSAVLRVGGSYRRVFCSRHSDAFYSPVCRKRFFRSRLSLFAASDGKSVFFRRALKGKTFVLFFYPKADTPGCTKEACGFRDAIAGYKAIDVPVFGIST